MKPQLTNPENRITDLHDDLVQRCRKGDHKAQLQVYKLYYKPVFSTCIQIVNDPVAAEELMEESFFLLLKT